MANRDSLIWHADRRPGAQRHRMRARALGLALSATAVLAACAPDTTQPAPTTDPSALYWSLTVDHEAVTLSLHPPYDTIRLVATPYTLSGAVVSGGSQPHFKSTDFTRVQVDSTGLVRAIKAGKRIQVVAVDTVGNVVHADTVWVNVIDAADPPPVLATLSIQPIAPDRAKTALVRRFYDPVPRLVARATDANGNAIPIDSLAVRYTSSDPSVATIDPVSGLITHYLQVGTVTFIASATAFGVTKADTLPFTLGLPLQEEIIIQTPVDVQGNTVVAFPPSPTIIGVGGDVIWENEHQVPVDVTFDDPTNAGQDDTACTLKSPQFAVAYCGAGDVPAWSADTSGDFNMNKRVRQFRAPGTYHYHDTHTGAAGTIIVQ